MAGIEPAEPMQTEQGVKGTLFYVAGRCSYLQLCGLNAHPGKAQRTSNALVFLGLMFALRIQPHKGTKSASCGSLALRTHDRRAVRRSECDPHLLLTQQKPCHGKSYELSWWKLISNRSWLSGGEANSRQRNGNGLSLLQVQSTLVCAV